MHRIITFGMLLAIAQIATAHSSIVRDANGQAIGVVESYGTTGVANVRSLQGVRFQVNLNDGATSERGTYYCDISVTPAGAEFFESTDCSGPHLLNVSTSSPPALTRCGGQVLYLNNGTSTPPLAFIPFGEPTVVRTVRSRQSLSTPGCVLLSVPSEISTVEWVQNDPQVSGVSASFVAPLTIEHPAEATNGSCVFANGYEACTGR